MLNFSQYTLSELTENDMLLNLLISTYIGFSLLDTFKEHNGPFD